MRCFRENNDKSVSCLAIAGTHSVLLGLNATDKARNGLIGFSIQRHEQIRSGRNKGKWGMDRYLVGALTFRETEPKDYLEEGYFHKQHKKGSDEYWHNLMARPIQDFLWGDWAAKPGRRYRYRIFPKYGTPASGEDLRAGPPVVVTVETETVDDPKDIHEVHFNRGVVASQAFMRRFPDIFDDGVKPKRRLKPGETASEVKLEDALAEPDSKVKRWLSRGLEEAILGFIAKAKGKGWGLRGCLYEFTYGPVLEALAAARDRGVDVQIVCEGKRYGSRVRPSKKDPGRKPGARQATGASNFEAVRKHGIEDIVTGRNGAGIAISHNKYLILLKDDKPISVWTGSTNITQGGILGHSNVGHSVSDPIVAGQYLKCWERIARDIDKRGDAVASAGDLRIWHDENTPVNPGGEPDHGTRVVFSPRGYKDLPCPYEALNYYASMLNGSQHSVFFTAAFGVSEEFTEMLMRSRNFLRFALLDNPGQAAKKGSPRKGAIDRTAQILKNERNRVAIGSYVPKNALEGWHEEHVSPINNHVRYLHTKYMLIDPLSDYPTVISGSANFSRNSTYSNDENMLVIEGNTRVADIYLTEFMRLWSQFYFRDTLTGALEAAKKGEAVSNWDITRKYQNIKPEKTYLASDDSWTDKYYEKDSVQSLTRNYFNGTGQRDAANRKVGAVRPRKMTRHE